MVMKIETYHSMSHYMFNDCTTYTSFEANFDDQFKTTFGFANTYGYSNKSEISYDYIFLVFLAEISIAADLQAIHNSFVFTHKSNLLECHRQKTLTCEHFFVLGFNFSLLNEDSQLGRVRVVFIVVEIPKKLPSTTCFAKV